MTTDGENRINVSLKVNQALDLKQNADIQIAYFKKENGVKTPIKTKAGNDLVKSKLWDGYLNGIDGKKYSSGYAGNVNYSDSIPANTLLLTTIDPKYSNMDYVDGNWVETPGELVAEIKVINNNGIASEVKEVRLQQ